MEHFASRIKSGQLSEASFDRQIEPYKVYTFTEADDMIGAQMAWQLQGKSYADFGYVEHDILEADGSLPAELDYSRGSNVTYSVAMPNVEGMDGWAAGRVVDDVLENQATFVHCYDTICPEERERLIEAARSGRRILELGAMALSDGTSSVASFSIVRDTVQRTIRENNTALMIGQQTPIALKGFRAMFGVDVVKPIGEPSTLEVGNGSTVELTPVCGDSALVLDGLLTGIVTAKDEKTAGRLTRSLVFMSDGLYADEMSDEVIDFIQRLGMAPKERV